MHLPRRFLALPLCLTLPTAACAEEPPAQRPANAEFRYAFDGGMRPNYRWLEIVGDEGHIRGRRGRQKFDFRFRVSSRILDTLWATFWRNRFTEIESRDRGKVYDRGGVTLTLAWAKIRIRVADSGNRFIDRRWRGKFRAVRAAMERVLNAELKQRGLLNTR